MRKSTLAILMIALGVSGCNRSANVLSSVNTQDPPQALPSVPAGSVQSSQLEPTTTVDPSSGVAVSNQQVADGTIQRNPDGSIVSIPGSSNAQGINNNSTLSTADTSTAANDPSASTQTQVAAATPEPTTTAPAKPLKHIALAGSWNVNTDNAGCRAILSFTQWSGGYRGTTKGCNSSELKAVKAWDIKGSQVVLVDTNGAQVAALNATSDSHYSGQTISGNPITFSR